MDEEEEEGDSMRNLKGPIKHESSVRRQTRSSQRMGHKGTAQLVLTGSCCMSDGREAVLCQTVDKL